MNDVLKKGRNHIFIINICLHYSNLICEIMSSFSGNVFFFACFCSQKFEREQLMMPPHPFPAPNDLFC